MFRLSTLFKSAAVVTAMAVVLTLPQRSQAQSTAALLKLLDHQFDTKDLQGPPMTLRESLSLLIEIVKTYDKKELPILIDTEAFKAENPDAPDVYDTKVQFPPVPKKMKVASAIRWILSRVETKNASYVVLPDHILITTDYKASPEGRLYEKVRAVFEKRPLEAALRELSDQAGATIVIDPRVGKKAKTELSAAFVNDIELGGALRVLTEMAELKVIILDGAIFVTTPGHVETLRKENQKKVMDNVKMRAQIEKAWASMAKGFLGQPQSLPPPPAGDRLDLPGAGAAAPDPSLDPFWPYVPKVGAGPQKKLPR